MKTLDQRQGRNGETPLVDANHAIDPAHLRDEIAAVLSHRRQHFARLWGYYRNPMRTLAVAAGESGSERPYRQAQEWGLPSRITGARSAAELLTPETVEGVARKEVVIENDIAWRIETLVDYLFGQPIVIESAAPDPARRQIISHLLRLILAHNGGIAFLQQLALLGSVYGFVDVLVKLDPSAAATSDAAAPAAQSDLSSNMCHLRDLGQPPASASKRNGATPDTNPSPDGAGPSIGSAGDVPRGPVLPTATGSAPHACDSSQDNGNHDDDDVDPQASSSRAPCLDPLTDPGASTPSLDAQLRRAARMVRLEIVEPARALPVLAPNDYRQVRAYLQVYHLPRNASGASNPNTDDAQSAKSKSELPRHGGWWGRFLRAADGRFLPAKRSSRIGALALDPDRALIVEVLTCHGWQRYEDETLVASGANSLGRIPLVHIQNAAVPFEYAGGSDVEPLIPLQDELNTRLSDRAHRITMQSFKMYLGKGIENFNSLPIAPGRMWMTDNEQADVLEFGGDSACPSEDAHIAEIREAIDKTSGVSPIAAGAIKGRIGRLTSAAALRVTMLALLARTQKKRTTYGAAIGRMFELAMEWLDRSGVFPNAPEERAVELNWLPHPIPENDMEKLQEAEVKARLGVPQEIVLRELGY